MKKKVVILAEFIGENHNSTAYYWSQITKYLNGDYEIVLIVPENEHSLAFASKYNIKTRFVKIAVHNKNNLLSRLLGQVKQTMSFLSVIKEEVYSADLLFSGTNPIVTMASLAVLKLRYKYQWLVLVHDVFPNNLIPAQVLSENSFFYKVLIYLSKKMYSSPDSLICIGRDMKTLLQEKTGSCEKIYYIPNWASTEKIPSLEKADNEIINDLGWQNQIVYQFFGNMGRLQGMDNLLKAIQLSKHKQARYLFIGCGSEADYVKKTLEKINNESGYEKIFFYGPLDLEKNHIGLSACDVSLVTLSGNMFGLGVPSKAYFSMAADKPILYVGDNNSELSILLSEYQVGWACEAAKPTLLAEQLDNVTDTLQMSDTPLMQPRKCLIDNFSETLALTKIKRVVNTMMVS
ncbi:glycosyltransferase family 4 protein [Shewanella sp. YLB-07]|uniref:glycosyltransferase family 4 protein n=1 Tax=Shewanella sp. YLB-07 TaxID=2601268 RepID=UPI002AD30A86|nr:glycosyltransferase family 4 protein [Shewanella sp. YLB-07]